MGNNKMKYKINDTVEFKAPSIGSVGIIVNFEEKSGIYDVELPLNKIIRCTEHYIKKAKVTEKNSV